MRCTPKSTIYFLITDDGVSKFPFVQSNLGYIQGK